jgi:aminoglycoside N3'-acetyltransferase
VSSLLISADFSIHTTVHAAELAAETLRKAEGGQKESKQSASTGINEVAHLQEENVIPLAPKGA